MALVLDHHHRDRLVLTDNLLGIVERLRTEEDRGHHEQDDEQAHLRLPLTSRIAVVTKGGRRGRRRSCLSHHGFQLGDPFHEADAAAGHNTPARYYPKVSK